MSEPRPDTPDTGAGTPLTAEEEAVWREALRDAPSLQRGLAPRDSSLLMVTIAEWSDRARRLLATLDAARSRPATDPAGLDALREAAESLDSALQAALPWEHLAGRDWPSGSRWLPAETLDRLPAILGLPCPIRSSLTDEPCVLPWGHPPDAPRFHRFARLSVADGPGPEERPVSDHRASRSDDEVMENPWAERSTCRECGRPITLSSNTPDRYGHQTRSWKHVGRRAALSRPLPENREEPSRG